MNQPSTLMAASPSHYSIVQSGSIYRPDGKFRNQSDSSFFWYGLAIRAGESPGTLAASFTKVNVLRSRTWRLAGEGLSGLIRAFFFAGAPSLLVSHWTVEDRATRELMTKIFQRYVSDGNLARAAQPRTEDGRSLCG